MACAATAMEAPIPQREFLEVPPGFRAMVEELADLAILILDTMDGDVDLEDGHDAEHDPAEAGIGDLDGMWEQGHLAGRGLEARR